MSDNVDKTAASADRSLSLSFPGTPHVDARTGDIVFKAYIGLRFIRCRVKRSALEPFAANPIPSQAELLAVFADYRHRIQRLVETEVLKGENAPVIRELDDSR